MNLKLFQTRRASLSHYMKLVDDYEEVELDIKRTLKVTRSTISDLVKSFKEVAYNVCGLAKERNLKNRISALIPQLNSVTNAHSPNFKPFFCQTVC